MNECQFQVLAAIRAYATRILAHSMDDVRPSTAKAVFDCVREMHNLKDKLDIKS